MCGPVKVTEDIQPKYLALLATPGQDLTMQYVCQEGSWL